MLGVLPLLLLSLHPVCHYSSREVEVNATLGRRRKGTREVLARLKEGKSLPHLPPLGSGEGNKGKQGLDTGTPL